jgi:hypothetical protein
LHQGFLLYRKFKIDLSAEVAHLVERQLPKL